MKIYVISTKWYPTHGQYGYSCPTTTRAFKTKESMIKAYEKWLNDVDEGFCNKYNLKRTHHYKGEFGKNQKTIVVYKIDNQTNQIETIDKMQNLYEVVELEE